MGVWYGSPMHTPSPYTQTAMETATYRVLGMTCDHCVRAVAEAVGEVAGVERVAVDLGTGRLDVGGDDVWPAEVRAAVADAGYEVAS